MPSVRDVTAASLRFPKVLALAIPLSALVGATAVLAGPFWSGALFLLRTPHGGPTHEQSSVHARHKGHVDIPTGLYIREDDDFAMDGNMAIVLRRTYLSGDRRSRHFGVGTTHSGEWYVRGDITDLTWAELILADGGRIRFRRVTPGTSLATAVFRHDSTPSSFYGAYLGWVGWKWAMRFADGSLAIFKACAPAGGDVCSLVEMHDGDGHSISYIRNLSGRLTSIRSGEQHVDLEYDASGRIVDGRDSSGRSVKYEYDGRGRLARVTTSDGIVRRYSYDDRDEMLTIDEPTWSIVNTFEDGRVVAQVTRMPDEDPYSLRFKYTVTNGRVTMNDVTENDGTHTVYRFNESGYVLSEVIDATGDNPISVTYDRSSATNVAIAMTIRCRTSDGHVVRTVPTESGFWDDEIKRTVIARECGVR